MNEKSNFYVFERKEIILVILFVIVTAITSFIFGLNIGANHAYEKAGHTGNDLKQITTETPKVDFTSTQEEKVEEIVKKEETKKVDINKEIQDSLKQKMIEEFSKENKKFVNAAPVQKNEMAEAPKVEAAPEQKIVEPDQVMEEAPSAQEQSDDNFSGKYTIQLSSFQSLAEAKQFAEGFKVLGYNPIINEKNIPGRGNWFRVSLGVFNSLSETKDYILKHKSLFAERDYVLTKFE